MENKVDTIINHIKMQVGFYLRKSVSGNEVALVNLDSIVTLDQEIIEEVAKKLIGTKISNKVIDDVFLVKTNEGKKVIVSW